MHDAGFLIDLATVLGVAAVTGWLFQRLGQPSILGYLAAGFVVGPYVPIPLFADPDRIHALSEVGVVLVMFVVGLELRLVRLFRVLPTAGVTALVEVGALVGCGMAMGKAMGWSPAASLFLGASISISSTMVVSKVFDAQPVASEVRDHVMSVLVIQDVLAILLAAVLTALAAGSALSAGEVTSVVGRLLGVLVAIVVLGLLVVPRMVRAAADTGSAELLVLVCVGLCFGLAVLAEELGYSGALGAFFAGVLVAESGRGEHVEHLVRPLRDVFAAVFFVAVGMSVAPRLAFEHADTALLVFAVVVVVQLLTVSVTGVLAGNGVRRAVTAGMALGQVGEFGFILSDIGIQAGIAPKALGPIVVTVAMLTAFSTPVMLRRADALVRASYRALPTSAQHLLGLYETWFETMRKPSPSQRTPLFRTLLVAGIDGAALVVLAGAVGSWLPTLSTLARHELHIPPPWGEVVVDGVAALLAVLLLVSLERSTRRLGRRAAERVFGPEPEAAERDLSRRMLEVAVQSLVLIGVGVPSAVLATPFVGSWFELVVGLALALELWRLWRMAGDCAPALRSSADHFVDLLARQAAPLGSVPGDEQSQATHAAGVKQAALDADGGNGRRETTAEEDSPATRSSHGLQLAQGLRLPDDAHAVGKTLAELDLRAQTGATVVAIGNPETGNRLPTGEELLRSGDVLAMAGSSEAIERAQQLLLHGPPPPEPEKDAPEEAATGTSA